MSSFDIYHLETSVSFTEKLKMLGYSYPISFSLAFCILTAIFEMLVFLSDF